MSPEGMNAPSLTCDGVKACGKILNEKSSYDVKNAFVLKKLRLYTGYPMVLLFLKSKKNSPLTLFLPIFRESNFKIVMYHGITEM